MSEQEQMELPLEQDNTPQRLDINGCYREFAAVFGVNLTKEAAITGVEEELYEMREAIAHLLKEMADVIYVLTQAEHFGVQASDFTPETGNNIMKMVAYINAIRGDVMDECVRRVHVSNMSKLYSDGSVFRREDGKVLKGPNYIEPNLMDLV
ncbi:MAG: hypothetical protein PHE17_19810 [Thiothrix sp.]|uniref:hypothetical protein n=1 Tax=Thiothrix sp. TaxID=1032 RepID=UPI00262D73BE|nr:hypothetical protein [Thiothrix sp.]MDD5395275.1 hypothetical protein [Thiothrix sp.]